MIGSFHSNNPLNGDSSNFNPLSQPDFNPLTQVSDPLNFSASGQSSKSPEIINLFSDDFLSKIVSKSPEKIYIKKISFLQITQTENSNILQAQEIDNPENNPAQMNRTINAGELLIEAMLSNGQGI